MERREDVTGERKGVDQEKGNGKNGKGVERRKEKVVQKGEERE